MDSEADILIVEDSPTQAMQLQGILERHGYRISVARNGREALSSLKEHKPTLVISDILMPEMDGCELCRQIKADVSLKDISVVLLTALSDTEDVIRALECGADNFYTKPYDEPHLLARIQHILTNLELRRNGETQKDALILLGDRKHHITAERQQILDLLLSVYEAAVQKNRELIRTQGELRELNEQLEAKVEERTAALTAEVAERKRAEDALQAKSEEVRAMTQQLWQAAKLATMGELAASIAHELNNPLATVSLRVESLLTLVSEDDPKRRAIEVVEQEVERMGNLVANLLQFSRRSGQQISTLDVREEIEKTLELIHYHLRNRRIAVVQEFAPDVPMIHADRQQMRQLFLNLFTNASDAMAQGGTLTLRVRMGKETPPRVVIEIADTGVGIVPEDLSRVMEPFFTTKGEGKGTGLGLAICRRVVQEHRGTLDIESEGGKGTTVRIMLPVMNGTNAKALREL